MNSHRSGIQLALFFTQGMSLQAWEDIGMFEREVALYRAMSKHLRQITFVTYGDRRDRQFIGRLEGIRVLCNQWRLSQWWYERWVARVLAGSGQGNVVIKSNQVRGADIALAAAQRLDRQFIARCGYLLSDNTSCAYGPDSIENQDACALERHVFTQANRVVVTTSRIRRTVLQRYRLQPDRVHVIPNYVDTTLFAPINHGDPYPARLCYIGRLEPEKNPEALIEAIRGLDVELLVIGNGSLGTSLREQVTKHQLSVKFLGNVPNRQLPNILNSVSIFVMPSLLEGHPKALLEAMACGLPVIGTDVPGIRELIRHRETGYLCDCSPGGIRAAICDVIADRELQERMGNGAREYVKEHFALEKIVKLELGLLEEMSDAQRLSL
jgi:glycosyltransferase involved in cell wall biosynthesis